MSARSVLYLIVTLVISAHYFVLYSDVCDKRTFHFLFACYVGDRHTLYLTLIVTLVISGLSLLYLIVTLVISVHYFCISWQR